MNAHCITVQLSAHLKLRRKKGGGGLFLNVNGLHLAIPHIKILCGNNTKQYEKSKIA